MDNKNDIGVLMNDKIVRWTQS